MVAVEFRSSPETFADGAADAASFTVDGVPALPAPAGTGVWAPDDAATGGEAVAGSGTGSDVPTRLSVSTTSRMFVPPLPSASEKNEYLAGLAVELPTRLRVRVTSRIFTPPLRSESPGTTLKWNAKSSMPRKKNSKILKVWLKLKVKVRTAQHISI